MILNSHFKYLFLIFVCFYCLNYSFAQPDGIYRIKLLTVGKESDLRIFNSLKDLGVIDFEPFMDDKLRVYLGNYLGKSSAEKILPMVLQKGFKGAFIEKTSKTFVDSSGDSLTHTLQFIALKKLDIRTILSNPKFNEPDKKDIIIWYHNGFYRVSLGMINEKQTESIAQYKAKTAALGFSSFSQKFAGVAPVKETQNNPSVLPNFRIPEVKKIEQKNVLEKEFNKAVQPKTATPSGTLDPILVPKEAKINPNAKLKPVKQ